MDEREQERERERGKERERQREERIGERNIVKPEGSKEATRQELLSNSGRATSSIERAPVLFLTRVSRG